MIAIADMTPGALIDAQTEAQRVALDPTVVRVTWDVDTCFYCLITPIVNSLGFESGGSIQEYLAAMDVPRLFPDGQGGYYEQLTDGTPGEGDLLSVNDKAYEVGRVTESVNDSGWNLSLRGPDQQ